MTQTQTSTQDKFEKIFHWLLFIVMIAIIPFLLKLGFFAISNGKARLDLLWSGETWKVLFSDGDLALVCVAILADVTGESLVASQRTKVQRILGSIAFLFCLLSWSFFALAMTVPIEVTPEDWKNFITVASMVLFPVSFFNSFICKLLS